MEMEMENAVEFEEIENIEEDDVNVPERSGFWAQFLINTAVGLASYGLVLGAMKAAQFIRKKKESKKKVGNGKAVDVDFDDDTDEQESDENTEN